jgi:hypothetical protein
VWQWVPLLTSILNMGEGGQHFLEELRQGAKTTKQDQNLQWTTPKTFSYEKANSADRDYIKFAQFALFV